MVLKETYHIARKEHFCDMCDIILDSWGISGFTDLPLTFAEKRAVVKAKQNGWKILPGERYYYTVQTFEDFATFKAIPAIKDIFMKYKLYEEW